jgi:CubicO group peptidase (beta-lactamase class C family)
LTTKLKEVIEGAANRSAFSGVVAITSGDVDDYRAAFGFRDVKSRLLNNVGTKFGIASGTKFFTALGIGRLIDEGLLSLTTTMEQIDRNFRGFIDEKATILNLLTHTSGVYDYYDEEEITDFDHFFVEIPWHQLTTPSDYLPLFENKPMKFRPDERYSYSNGGFVLLGVIIEKISGRLYRDFITENVLTPAGMQDSGFFAFNDLPENTASGYLEDRVTTNIYNLPLRGGGDGGMYTTAGDLSSFWEALFSRKILSPGLTDEYLKTYWKFDETEGYGCGVYKKIDGSAYSIVGGDAGVGFFSRHVVKENTTISVLSNVTNGEEGIVDSILHILENGE